MNKYTATVLTALLLAGQSVIAQPMGGRSKSGMNSRGRGGHQLMRIANDVKLQEEIGITEEEADKLQDISYDLKKAMIGLKAAKETAGLELQQLLEGDAPDEAAVMAAADKVNAAASALMKAGLSAQLKVKEILGAEKVAALEEAGRDRKDQWKQKRNQRKEGKSQRGKGQKKQARWHDNNDDDEDDDEDDD